MERRATDPRIDTLSADVAELKRQMTENTIITKQVKEVLDSFKLVASVAKWITTVAAAIALAWQGLGFIRGK